MRVGLSLVLSWLLLGCSPAVEWTQMRTPPRPMRPRRAGNVQVFTTQPPRWRYVEVGIIESREGTLNGTGEYVLADIRNEAAERGCDGLLLNIMDQQVSSFSMTRAGAFGNSGTERAYRAICIVFDGP